MRTALTEAFVAGGSGVWEQARAWLRKLVIDEMPPALARQVSDRLKADGNKQGARDGRGKTELILPISIQERGICRSESDDS